MVSTNNFSISLLQCKSLLIIINFHVLRCIYHTSSLVYFKNCPGCLNRGTVQVLIPLMRFQPQNLVSTRFLVYYFSFFSVCLMMYASNIPKYFQFSFSFRAFFPDLIVPLPIMCMLHFSMPNTIRTYWLYILIVCIWVNYLIFLQKGWYHRCRNVIRLFLGFCKFVASSTFSMYVIGWHHCYYKY